MLLINDYIYIENPNEWQKISGIKNECGNIRGYKIYVQLFSYIIMESVLPNFLYRFNIIPFKIPSISLLSLPPYIHIDR